jgi:hypothetical protein
MKATIFLDIDGVLCGYNEYNRPRKKFWDKYDDAKQLKIPYPFNPGCVNILNEILEITDADIVLSSDWRFHFTLDELDKIFKFNKVIKSPIDVTGNFPMSFSQLDKNRAHDIDIYRQEHNIINYVIVDDLNLESYVPKERFVKTIEREGIKQCNIKQKILKILQYEQK